MIAKQKKKWKDFFEGSPLTFTTSCHTQMLTYEDKMTWNISRIPQEWRVYKTLHICMFG